MNQNTSPKTNITKTPHSDSDTESHSEDKKSDYRPTSAYPFLIATSLMFMMVCMLFHTYGILHWQLVFDAGSIKANNSILKRQIGERLNGPDISSELQILSEIEKLNTMCDNISSAAISGMSFLEWAYRLAGLTTFLFSIAGVKRKPDWAGYATLGIGILGLLLAMVIM